MKNNFVPPKEWFDTAIEVVQFACKRKKIADFIADAKLRPQIVGKSYSYRIDVMEQLIRAEIVVIEDDRLTINNSIKSDWLNSALISGHTQAWRFARALNIEESIERKFNPDVLKRIGDIGEAFVLNELNKFHPQELRQLIKHVALSDDTLGYDIQSPSTLNSDANLLIEVKTSVRQPTEKFQFYLSRNEFEVGISNRNWCIVAVSILDDKPVVLGHLYCYQIESRLPRNVDTTATWASCKLSIETEILRPGLP